MNRVEHLPKRPLPANQSASQHAPIVPVPDLQLPDPSQHPDRDIFIFDGQCNFCRSQVERLRRWDSGKLAYISLHDSRISKICPTLSHEQLMRQMWLVTASGDQHGGADAARVLSRQLPKLFWLMPLLHIPFSMPLWRWIYSKVAASRYRISGRTCDGDTCSIHTK